MILCRNGRFKTQHFFSLFKNKMNNLREEDSFADAKAFSKSYGEFETIDKVWNFNLLILRIKITNHEL